MREPGVQREDKKGATITSNPILPPALTADKRRAPVAILSPTKRAAIIECFSNSGLHKRRGYWCGTAEGKHISGATVADLARDGMFSVERNSQIVRTFDRTRSMVCTDADGCRSYVQMRE